MRSIVCNPQLVAECNHFEEMYVIHRRWYVINPKAKTYNPCGLMTYSSLCELITYALRRLHTNPSDWILSLKINSVTRGFYLYIILYYIFGLAFPYFCAFDTGTPANNKIHFIVRVATIIGY